MKQFFSDFKAAFKEFRFTSPDIDSSTQAQKFLRAARPIVLASSLIVVGGIFQSSNDEYQLNRSKGKQKEDILQEFYTKVRSVTRPIYFRYLDLIPEEDTEIILPQNIKKEQMNEQDNNNSK